MKNKDVLRAFAKLDISRSSSNHHIRGFIVSDDGRKLFPPVYVSKGNKELSPFLIDKIRKSMFLTRDELKTMGACKISRSEYFEIRFEKTNGD